MCQINFTDCLEAATVYLISGVRSVSLNSTNSTHAVVSPAFYSVQQTAIRLGLAPQTISNWICQGRSPIRSVMVGGRRLFPICEVENFIAQLVSGGADLQAPSSIKTKLGNEKRGRGRPRKLSVLSGKGV